MPTMKIRQATLVTPDACFASRLPAPGGVSGGRTECTSECISPEFSDRRSGAGLLGGQRGPCLLVIAVAWRGGQTFP